MAFHFFNQDISLLYNHISFEKNLTFIWKKKKLNPLHSSMPGEEWIKIHSIVLESNMFNSASFAQIWIPYPKHDMCQQLTKWLWKYSYGTFTILESVSIGFP